MRTQEQEKEESVLLSTSFPLTLPDKGGCSKPQTESSTQGKNTKFGTN